MQGATLYGRVTSSNVMKCRWLVAELDLVSSVAHVPAGGRHALNASSPEFRRLNPSGLVPCLRLASGETLAESNSILRYAADEGAGKGAGLRGETSLERALVNRWLDYGLGTLEPRMKPLFFHEAKGVPLPSQEAVAKALDEVKGAWQLVETTLEGNTHLVLNRFTLADIALGPQLHRFQSLQCTRAAAAEGFPNLKKWYHLLKQRPAYQEHVTNIPIE